MALANTNFYITPTNLRTICKRRPQLETHLQTATHIIIENITFSSFLFPDSLLASRHHRAPTLHPSLESLLALISPAAAAAAAAIVPLRPRVRRQSAGRAACSGRSRGTAGTGRRRPRPPGSRAAGTGSADSGSSSWPRAAAGERRRTAAAAAAAPRPAGRREEAAVAAGCRWPPECYLGTGGAIETGHEIAKIETWYIHYNNNNNQLF